MQGPGKKAYHGQRRARHPNKITRRCTKRYLTSWAKKHRPCAVRAWALDSRTWPGTGCVSLLPWDLSDTSSPCGETIPAQSDAFSESSDQRMFVIVVRVQLSNNRLLDFTASKNAHFAKEANASRVQRRLRVRFSTLSLCFFPKLQGMYVCVCAPGGGDSEERKGESSSRACT